ncbi:hypothetical protein WT77_15500 [Burkholderia stagnalis]|uniref:hypothetical protein n=1 Tax=Burkholderia stagnalis TaxID=1503054 RepID=UPI00075F912B|nr:hypothetical protein WT77_15500 [Burkholderia stagnalis]KWK50901.1 hypothetical protein WT80_12085 [Burkholderia stagnalis]KWK52034.1 hypothetical protein WT81_25910 [Burkholderia stagnalis]KWN66768.1 hypothetical protein WT90_30610 [Burkholderia stagnalis]
MRIGRVEHARHLREHRAAIQAARRAGQPRFVAVGRPAASSHRPFSFDRSDGASLGVGALERQAEPGPGRIDPARAVEPHAGDAHAIAEPLDVADALHRARSTGAGSRRTHTHARPAQRRWPVRRTVASTPS